MCWVHRAQLKTNFFFVSLESIPAKFKKQRHQAETNGCMHLKINLPLVFWETIILIKNACNKQCVCWWDLQLLCETFFWILHISWDKPKKPIFLWFFYDFTMKIKFAPIFTIIFVISASKYINIQSLKKIGHTSFSEIHPKWLLFVCFMLLLFQGRNFWKMPNLLQNKSI